MERETYPYKMVCGNCEADVTIAIPKGVTRRGYFKSKDAKDAICPKCGCNVQTGR